MDCPACDAVTVDLSVPDSLAEHAPASAVAVCGDCLTVAPLADPPADPDDPGQVSGALPADETAAVALLLAVDSLSSLATNREAIESLLGTVERRGADPLLAFERLAADPGLSPAVDLDRRRRQLESMRS